ncbi:uncharacterized protein LOC129588661 [Paramacrobiotus metropolitanus]|uniref:uncharacterized protein LOC129588661 n=1 Tax=Paramacrobiotus metropolitanus TaxID=2943436 RepID=UPI0024465AEF|nr:uncharacterized protein LOC129588661 [Paramacrobiotus metropolitanus]
MGYQTKHPRTIVVLASIQKYLGSVFGLLLAFGLGIFSGQQECHTSHHGEHPEILFSWRRWTLMTFEILDIICMLIAGKIGRSAIAFKHGQCQQRNLRRFFALNVIGLMISISDMITTICILLDVSNLAGNIWIIDAKSDFYLPATVIFFVFIVMKIGIQAASLLLSFDCVFPHPISRSHTLLDFDGAALKGDRKSSISSHRKISAISNGIRKSSLPKAVSDV